MNKSLINRLKSVSLVCSIFFALINPCSAQDTFSRDIATLKSDYQNFYFNTNNLLELGAGIAGAAIIANTSADREVQKYYQDHIRGGITNDISKGAKIPGEFFITPPLLLGVYFLSSPDSPGGVWAQKSLRALAVGLPSALIIENATGASTPEEGGSKWNHPFKHDSGLSNHAFIGAIPFITAAKMFESPYMKAFFYGVSTLPGLSRVNDNKHYFSQAALGWYLAYLSCNAIDRTENRKGMHIGLVPVSNGALVLFSGNF